VFGNECVSKFCIIDRRKILSIEALCFLCSRASFHLPSFCDRRPLPTTDGNNVGGLPSLTLNLSISRQPLNNA